MMQIFPGMIYFSVSSNKNVLAYHNVLISMKKDEDVVHQKSYFNATQIKVFPDLEVLGFVAFTFFCKKMSTEN